MDNKKSNGMVSDWIDDHSDLLCQIGIGAFLLIFGGIALDKFIKKNEKTLDYFKDKEHMI